MPTMFYCIYGFSVYIGKLIIKVNRSTPMEEFSMVLRTPEIGTKKITELVVLAFLLYGMFPTVP